MRLLGAAGERPLDVPGSVTMIPPSKRRVGDAILSWEGQGYRTRRLDGALTGALTPAQADRLIRRFEEDVARLRAIEAEIRAIDPYARELSVAPLRDPDRLDEAKALLAAVRKRWRPPPAPPPGPGLPGTDAREILGPEKVPWEWPYLEDWVVEPAD